MKTNTYFYALWCLLLVPSFSLFAQADWQFETHSNNITGISIDSQMIWLSTRNGIFKFNKSTQTYSKYTSKTTSLTDDFMTGILVMPDDSLWVSYYYFGAGHSDLEAQSWANYEVNVTPLRSNFVRTMKIAPSGAVYMGTFYGGVNIYKNGAWSFIDNENSPLPISNSSGGIVQIAFNNDSTDTDTWFGTRYHGLYHQEDTTWTRYDVYNSPVPHHIISGLAIDKDKRVWIGTHDGLAVKDTSDNWHVFKQIDSPLPTGFVRDLAVTDSSVWVATKQGLVQIPTTTMDDFDSWDVFLRDNSGLPSNRIERLKIDTLTGDLWIGTYSHGLVRYDGEIWTTFDFKDSEIVDNDILSLNYEERDSTLFVCTRAGGLGIFRDSAWTILNEETGLPTDQVNFAAEDTSGNVWIGYSFDGLTKWDGDTFVHYNNLNSPLKYPLNVINDVYIDENDSIWLAVNGGIWSFNQHDSIWTFMVADSTGANQDVTSIQSDGQGGFWYAGRFNTLKHFDGTGIEEFDTPDNFLKDAIVTDLELDEWNNIWIGTFGKGLLKMDTLGNWFLFNATNSGIQGNSISSLEYTPDSVLWIGTTGVGMYAYNLGVINHFDVYTGHLPQNNVADLQWDSRGTLWVGMPQMGLGSHHIEIYTKPDDTLTTNNLTPFAGKISIYPNPVDKDLHLDIHSEHAGKALISFFSMDGHLVREEAPGMIAQGHTEMSFDIADFPCGNYYLQLFVDGEIGLALIHKE